MKKYLTDQDYQQYLSTYTVAQKESVIYSILTMCDLLNTTAKFLSQQLHYAYDKQDKTVFISLNMLCFYIRMLKHLINNIDLHDIKALYDY